jgi:hypothetical protein
MNALQNSGLVHDQGYGVIPGALINQTTLIAFCFIFLTIGLMVRGGWLKC